MAKFRGFTFINNQKLKEFIFQLMIKQTPNNFEKTLLKQ